MKQKSSLKRVLLLLVLIAIFVVLLFFVYKLLTKDTETLGGKVYIIELGQDGFRPKELTIQKGDTVTFKTSLDKLFWPASNVHPSHSIYSEFDPRKPIDFKESWSFQFNKAGKWRFHDHLAPHHKGTIVVLNKGEFIENSAENSKWEELIFSAFKDKGMEASFDVLLSLYNTEPSFSSSCHDITHRIGETAYLLFSEDKDFEVTPKTAYCSYGFYHGFMESLLSKTGDLEETRKFCEYVDKQLANTAPDATLQCYHGIGHGAIDISVAGDKSVWGKEENMVVLALEICEEVAGSSSQLSRCATGVYNGIGVFYMTNQYQLSMREEDPLWLCQKQPKEYKAECYLSMNTALLSFAGMNFSKAAGYIENIVEDDHASRAILNLAAPVGTRNINTVDHREQITACRSLQERLRLPCIQGYAFGFLEHGEPGVEYIKPLDFCGSQELKEDEQGACFEYIFSYLPLWYPKEKAHQICKTVESQRRDFCYLQINIF